MFVKGIALLVVAHCLVATAEDEKVKLLRLGVKCREENSLKPAQVEQLKNPRRLETTDGNVKCFLKCMMTGMNMMTEAGDITVEGLEGDGAVTKYRAQYLACKDVTGTDPCDKALSFHKCVWSQTQVPPEGGEAPN